MHTPAKYAHDFGIVRRENYLAHSIREIELFILRHTEKDYHIVTKGSERITDDARVYFHDRGCSIIFPYGDGQDDYQSRIILAHELGHLIYNVDKLHNPDDRNSRSPNMEEEIFSWEFAFNLIKVKSAFYKNSLNQKLFIFEDHQLNAHIIRLVNKHAPDIVEKLEARLRPGA